MSPTATKRLDADRRRRGDRVGTASADGNPDFDEGRRRALRGDAEAEPRAFAHAGRHAQPHLVRRPTISPSPPHGSAPFRPHLAAAAAARARPPQRHVQRHERAPERLLRADDDFRRQRGFAAPPKNESRIRSSTLATDGKSMATSSASQSARLPASQAGIVGAAPLRRRAALRTRETPRGTPPPRSSPEMSG